MCGDAEPTLPELPPLRNQVDVKFINATPKGYALRILRVYRQHCNERWEVHGLDKAKTLIYDAMNQHQVERAKELDKAIAILEKEMPDTLKFRGKARIGIAGEWYERYRYSTSHYRAGNIPRPPLWR